MVHQDAPYGPVALHALTGSHAIGVPLDEDNRMTDSAAKDLAYHHSEIARLTAAIEVARPNASSTNALRTKLKYHEDRIGRPVGVARTMPTPW